MTVVCSAEVIRKASVLALFGAIRASVKKLEDARLAFEQLAVRLDILASIGLPVSRDPEVESLVKKLSSMRLEGFKWVLDEICNLLSCMRAACATGSDCGEK